MTPRSQGSPTSISGELNIRAADSPVWSDLTGRVVRAMADYSSKLIGHLTLRRGDLMVVVGREGKWCVVKNAFGAEGNVPVSYVKVEVDMQASDVTDLGLAETSAIQGDLAVKMSQISMSPTQTPSPSSFNTFRGTPTRGAASPVTCLSPSSSGAVSAIVPPLTKKEMKAAAKAVKAAEKKEKKDKKSKKRISQLSS